MLTEPFHPSDHFHGPADAELELLMYGDFECPYCVAAQRIVARVVDRLGDRLRFVFRHFPIEKVHPHALHAAYAAEAAAEQGKFWEMHDALFAGRGRLEDPDLLEHSKSIGLDEALVFAALQDNRYQERVAHDVASGKASGVTGTPGFFANGRIINGAFDAGSLISALTT